MAGLFDDHLALDAVVAYVDGELSLTAFQRASAHLVRCSSCAAEVADQVAAQQLLRAAELPRMPGSLFDALRSIPVAAPLDPPLAEHDPTRSVLGRSRRLLPRRNRLDH